MVSLGWSLLHGQHPWEYYVLVISGILIITFLTSCTDCWKGQPQEATEVEEEEGDADEYVSNKRNKKFGRISIMKKGLYERSRTRSLPTITEQPPTSHVTLPDITTTPEGTEIQPKNEDISRLSRFKALRNQTRKAFQSTEIQPQREDIMPLETKSLLGRTRSAPSLKDMGSADDIGDGDDVGTLYFTLSYDTYEKVLKLNVQKAVHLAAKDITGTSDPYVRVLLLPDKKQKLETKVKRKELNPVWNEVLTFQNFPLDALLKRILHLQVLDYDNFSRADPIGDTEVALADAGLQTEPVKYVKKLRPHKKSSRKILGDILISLWYDQTLGRISVTIMKCRNLKAMDVTGKCDPYVKVYTLYSGRRVDKKKTEVKKRQLNPVWNDVLEFELPLDKARSVTFVFTVMDFDAVLPNKPIGEIRIGYRTIGPTQHHWTEMLYNPKKPIAMWHTLVKAQKTLSMKQT